MWSRAARCKPFWFCNGFVTIPRGAIWEPYTTYMSIVVSLTTTIRQRQRIIPASSMAAQNTFTTTEPTITARFTMAALNTSITPVSPMILRFTATKLSIPPASPTMPTSIRAETKSSGAAESATTHTSFLVASNMSNPRASPTMAIYIQAATNTSGTAATPLAPIYCMAACNMSKRAVSSRPLMSAAAAPNTSTAHPITPMWHLVASNMLSPAAMRTEPT